MCGIWAVFGFDGTVNPHCQECFAKLQHRGPEAWRLEHDSRIPRALLGFHRLAIVDGLYGMQPMKLHKYPKISLICNGEIYNCKRLQKQFNFPYETDCDVEAIIHLMKTKGIEETVSNLDGVFGFILVDAETQKVYVARDPYGVRPLFRLHDAENGILSVSSEAKSLIGLKEKTGKSIKLEPFPPGHFEEWSILPNGTVKLERSQCYFKPGYAPAFQTSVSKEILLNLNKEESIAILLEEACRKRLMSDRRIGCMLSGGLDSSLIAGLVVKLAKEQNLPYKIQTFSIGMGDSPDLIAAREVAKHLDTEHHEVKFDENDVRKVLDSVIYSLESYDITTIRASIPMFILSKYIKDKTDTTVIFSGEGADEVAQGYIYFRDAPSPEDAHKESLRLLGDIYLYDGLRADRTTCAFSLELRVPFLDLQFTNYFLSLDPTVRQPQKGVEKQLIRSSFVNSGLIPDSILWRHKEAFSDGVASAKKSLFVTLEEIINERFSENNKHYEGTQPHTKESKYYREVFEKLFPGQSNFTPYYWMPKWVEAKDPSARFIKHYAAS